MEPAPVLILEECKTGIQKHLELSPDPYILTKKYFERISLAEDFVEKDKRHFDIPEIVNMILSLQIITNYIQEQPFNSTYLMGDNYEEVQYKFKIIIQHFEKNLKNLLDNLFNKTYNLEDKERVSFFILVLENILCSSMRKNIVFSEKERACVIHVFIWDNVFLVPFIWKRHSSFFIQLGKGEKNE